MSKPSKLLATMFAGRIAALQTELDNIKAECGIEEKKGPAPASARHLTPYFISVGECSDNIYHWVLCNAQHQVLARSTAVCPDEDAISEEAAVVAKELGIEVK